MRNLLKRESAQIAIVLILGLGGISFIIYSRTQLRVEAPAGAPQAAPSPEKKTPIKPDSFFPSPAPRTGSLPNSIRPSSSTAQAGAASEMASTPGCTTPGAIQSADSNGLDVSYNEMTSLQEGGKATIVLNESSKTCFRKNDSYSLYFIKRDQVSSVVVYRQLIGKARIVSIQTMPFNGFDVAAAAKKHVDFEVLEHVAEKTKDDDALFVSIVADGKVFLRENLAIPPANHPQATTIDKKMVIDLQQKGAFVVDVRRHNRFAFKTIPGAKNFPLGKSPVLYFTILFPSTRPNIVRRMQSFLPADKNTPIVVFNRGDGWVSFNAISAMAVLGYHNLYWYRGGFRDWLELPPPPLTFPGMGSITPAELSDQWSKGQLFIVDVRPLAFYQKLHFRSGSHFNFKASYDLSDMETYRPLKPTLADLKKNKEGFEPEDLKKIPVDRTIVVVGLTDPDWTAFKAAAELALRHYSVKLLRGGIYEYNRTQFENPRKLPIEPFKRGP